MENLGVFFGSRAAEHDVSIISGLQALENADKSKYNAFPVYVSRAGEWFVGEPLRNIATYKNFDPNLKGLTKVMLPPAPGMKGLYARKGLFGKLRLVQPLACALLAFHGLHGEDGTMQGLFELADIPYTSCGVVASAAGMDKIVMKAVFQSMGLPVLPSVWCYRDEWNKDREAVLARAEALGYPLFVKPSQLGSSIGISKVADRASLERAVEIACAFDWRILIEKGLDRPDEINCACVGFGEETRVSLCEQPVNWQEFLTFDQKYLAGGKGKGMESLARKIPAPIGEELTARVRDYTREIFRTFGCKGVVRVDYMLDRASGELYVCEINTIPGSFAFYLFEPDGLSFRHLVDALVGYAHEALAQKNGSTFAYDSTILDKALGGVKNSKK
jgi:D-alanine-D-alanine ligase